MTTETAIDLNNVDVDELKVTLSEHEVKFDKRMGAKKLVAIANEHDIEIPMLDVEDDEDDEEVRRNVVPAKYRERYGKDQHTHDDPERVGLDIAQIMKDLTDETVKDDKGKTRTGCSESALREIAEANGVDFGRWDDLNIGMKRMNLGNVLRGKYRRGEQVVLGDQTYQKPDDEADALD